MQLPIYYIVFLGKYNLISGKEMMRIERLRSLISYISFFREHGDERNCQEWYYCQRIKNNTD
jgi:hypothetical protein